MFIFFQVYNVVALLHLVLTFEQVIVSGCWDSAFIGAAAAMK